MIGNKVRIKSLGWWNSNKISIDNDDDRVILNGNKHQFFLDQVQDHNYIGSTNHIINKIFAYFSEFKSFYFHCYTLYLSALYSISCEKS